MAKFKMRLKLTGLEVEIEGERADIPQMASGVSQQMANLLQPSINIAAGKVPQLIEQADTNKSDGGSNENGRGGRGRKSGAAREGRSSDTAGVALDFAHKPDTWGNPLQSWTAIQKMIWLLYVYGQATSQTEMAFNSIAPTFKKHFKQSGKIHPPHVTRELGKAKGQAPALVGEDAAKTPSAWYLTDAGKAMGVQLVTEARGGAASHGAS